VPDIIPTVIVRDEEIYLARVLRPLVTVFGAVVLGDTGSTDATLDIAHSIAGVEVVEYGIVNPKQFTAARYDLGLRAAALGATWRLLVDGDELWCAATLRCLLEQPMPSGKTSGFATCVSVDADTQGTLWELADQSNSHRLIPAACKWHGAYPFDVPDPYDYPTEFHYFTAPPGYRYHFVHLHPLRRSSKDAEVMFRTQKQHQFSMIERDIPRTVPFDLEAWCVA
jgi:hypothetical protein